VIALDILINLKQLSQEYVNIERLYIGGENEDWPVENSDRPSFTYDDTTKMHKPGEIGFGLGPMANAFYLPRVRSS